MKIIIDEFEQLARCKGYRSGNELFKELGGGRSAYQCIKAGNRVGEGIVKAIYNKFGEKVLTEVVDMEEELFLERMLLK